MIGRAIDYRGGLRAAAQAASAQAASAGAAAGGGGGAGLPQWQPPRQAAPQDQYPSIGQIGAMVRGVQGPRPGAATPDGSKPKGGLGPVQNELLPDMAPAMNEGATGGLGAPGPGKEVIGGSAGMDGGEGAAGGLKAAAPQVPPYTALSLDAGPPGYAVGGLARGPGVRARRHAPAGLIHSATPGRADLVPARMRRGSYVIPADVVSGLGQGNTLAGAKMLHTTLPRAAEMASRGEVALAAGGMADEDDGIEVRLSGGEYQVAPDQVLAIGGGDVHEGARALDALVQAVRSQTKRSIEQMPPPK